MPKPELKEIRQILRSENYKLNIYMMGRGLVNVNPEKQVYQDGEKIQLSASSHDKWNFIRWHNADEVNDNDCYVTFDEDHDGRDIIAEFHPDFDIEIRGQGEVETTLNEEKSVFAGHYLDLRVIKPDTGFYFFEWSDNVADKENKETELKLFDIDKTNYKGQGIGIAPAPTNRSYSSFLVDNIENYRLEDSATAYFKRIKYYLDIDITGSGEVNITPEEDYYTYDYGEVLISASADKNWKFYEFRGDTENFERQNNSFITYFDEEVDEESYTYNIEAVFTPELKVNIEPTEEDVEVDTIGDTEIIFDPDQDYYEIGAEVNIDVNVPAGWQFSHWSDNVESPQDKSTKVIMNEPQKITCYLEAVGYELNINITGEGTVKVEPEKDYYHLHDMVTLTAEPADNWRFDSWDYNDKDEKEINIIIDDDFEIEASFGPALDTNITGEGTITIDPDKEYYDIDEEVNLTVTPDEAYQFMEWQGGVEDSGAANTTVIMDQYKKITAVLEILKYNLDVSIVRGVGEVEIIPDQETYEHGSIVTVKITPEGEYEIIEWSGDLEDPEKLLNYSETELDMTANKKIEIELYKVFTLTVSSWGDGYTIPEEESYKYREGTEVDLEARTDGCPFIKWSGNIDEDYYEKKVTVTMDQDRTANAIFDSNALGFFEIDPGDEFDIEPGETVEIDVSAYFRWGDDDKIEYIVSDLPANAEFDRENLVIRWTPFPED